MTEDPKLTRRSFAKGTAIGLGLLPRTAQSKGPLRAPETESSEPTLGDFKKNISEFEMNNPLIGFPLQILWPDRIRTTAEFDPYDIYVGNSAFSPLQDLSNITRRIEGGNFIVYEGNFEAADIQSLLEEQYYSPYTEIEEFSVMTLGSKMIGFTDGVAFEGNYVSTRANLKRIEQTIENRRQDDELPETAPEFAAIMSELDTSYLAIARFNTSISDTVPQLGSLTDSIKAVGQSSTPDSGEIQNRTALLFDDRAEEYVTNLDSTLADITDERFPQLDSTLATIRNLGFQRLNSPTIETNGRVATITESRAAANALNI